METSEVLQGIEVERTASVGSLNDLSSYYVDEEDVLGFHVWVAELELLVGNSKGQRLADPYACFELLQKLLVTIDQSESSRVREYQRRCEAALYEILLKGARPPVCPAIPTAYLQRCKSQTFRQNEVASFCYCKQLSLAITPGL
jgi:hypothetical protein